jgi:hypothetical protein
MLLFSGISSAGGVGTTGAQFLKIGSGARAASMSGAFAAVSDDLSAIYWNPAGLARQKQRQASASYIKYFQGINIGFLAYSQDLRGNGTLGVGIDYLTINDIEKRTADTDTSAGTFGANDMALYLAYARENVFPGIDAGANLKIIKQSIDSESAQSYALDLAALYKTPVENLTASFGVYNVGTQVKFVNEGDPLPLDIKLGFAYRMFENKLVLAADMDDYINDSRIYTQLGAEYVYRSMLSFRAGYRLGTDASKLGGSTGLGAGIGVNVWNVQLDYAFVPFGELNDTHWMSISTKF